MKTTNKNNDKFLKACEKELVYVRKQEAKLKKNACKDDLAWKKKISEKVPPKLEAALKKAFSKAFELLFTKGTGIIEKTYDKDELKAEHKINSYAINEIASRKSLKRLRKSSSRRDILNCLCTTAEGTVFGVLGIGLPDIVTFIGFLLRGIYEVALQYGIDYTAPEERLKILKMIEGALSKNEKWSEISDEVDSMLISQYVIDESEIKMQISKTADIMALDMLVLKFIQGIPIIGIAGGLYNPVYYRKILKYVRLKYHKQFLTKKFVINPINDRQNKNSVV